MYYNLAKTAEILGLQTGDVNRLREQGKLRAFKDGADWKFRKEEVEQYLTKMIKERSAQNSGDGLLATGDDEDKTEFAVDSSAFDAMFDQAGDDLQVSANDVVSVEDDGLQLAPAEDDDLKLAEDDDLKLAPEESSEAALVKEGESSLTSEDSALAEDLAAIDLASGSGSGSGDGLSLGSDSGLSLLDDVGGSNIDLAGDDGDDLILGGSTGSGSGDGMSLGSDSGLSLMDDAEGGFELDAAVSEQGGLDLAPKKDEDDSVFALAGEDVAAGPQILNLDQNADSEAPTELAAEESVFELSSQTTDAPQSSESMSSSVFMTEDAPSETANPFLTDDSAEDDGGIFALAGESETSASVGVDESASNSIEILDDSSVEAAADPFMSEQSTDSPFGDSSANAPFTPGSDSSPFGGDSFGGGDFGSSSDFGEPSGFDASSDFSGATFAETDAAPAASGVSSMQFTGKDLIFLVPCLIFLLLATIGALELCRTIWSYQEGTFDLGGPLLETIAKMVKLM